MKCLAQHMGYSKCSTMAAITVLVVQEGERSKEGNVNMAILRASVDWMLPIHIGEGHLLY